MLSPRFGNLYELLDALMLFGASIESPDATDGLYRLRLRRRRVNGARFAWVLIVLESQDEQFEFLRVQLSLSDADVWDARTRSTRFLRTMRERWYPGASTTAVTPHIDLTDEMLTFWLVGSDSLNWLTAPGLSKLVGERLAKAINKRHGWSTQFIPAVCGRHAAGLDIPPDVVKEKVEAWLEARVPRAIWDRTHVTVKE